MRSICLLSVKVAVEGEGRMLLAIDNYDYDIFFKGGVQRNLYLNCVSLWKSFEG